MNIGALLSKRTALTRPPVIIGASIAAAVVLALIVKAFVGGGSDGANARPLWSSGGRWPSR